MAENIYKILLTVPIEDLSKDITVGEAIELFKKETDAQLFPYQLYIETDDGLESDINIDKLDVKMKDILKLDDEEELDEYHDVYLRPHNASASTKEKAKDITIMNGTNEDFVLVVRYNAVTHAMLK